MLSNIITSQTYLDDEIVAEKISEGDFEIQVSPEFEVDGETYRVLLDGHHSLAAAIESGATPVISEQDATDNDRVSLINDGDVDIFLEACWMDGDYRYAATGRYVW